MESIEALVFAISPYFTFIGSFLLILSYQKYTEIEHTKSKGLVADGVVLELRDESGKTVEPTDNHPAAPVVEFRTDNGKYVHYSTTYQIPSPYKAGQSVKIYYYIYKSIHHFALEDDQTGSLPGRLFRWGVVFCAIGFPVLVIKLSHLL